MSHSFECGPAAHGNDIAYLHQETKDFQESLASLFLQISLEVTLFRTKWVHQKGVLYKCNNAYLITKLDELDPLFGHLDETVIVGGNLIVFVVSMCKVMYFDSHYHAYAIKVTSHRSLLVHLLTIMCIMGIHLQMESLTLN